MIYDSYDDYLERNEPKVDMSEYDDEHYKELEEY